MKKHLPKLLAVVAIAAVVLLLSLDSIRLSIAKSWYLEEIRTSIEKEDIHKHMSGGLSFELVGHNDHGNGIHFLEYEAQGELTESFQQLSDKEKHDILYELHDSKYKELRYKDTSIMFEVSSFTFDQQSDEYLLQNSPETDITFNGESFDDILAPPPVVETNTRESYSPSIPASQSPYTREELEADPTAPSTNPDDYNSDGEYVPSYGPTDNPADYNSDGEYKPVEDMTQEEIQKELESMMNDIYGN